MKQRSKVKRLKARQVQYDDMMSRPDAPRGYNRPGSLKK